MATLKGAVSQLKPKKAPFLASGKGSAGYDNPRQNIDPHIVTKVLDAKEIYKDGVAIGSETDPVFTSLSGQFVQKAGDLMTGNLIFGYSISDDVLISNDASVSIEEYGPKLMKTITLGSNVRSGTTLRLTFKFTAPPGETIGIFGSIYRNGTPVGTEQYTLTEETFTEDITGWNAGDEIRIYANLEYDGGGPGSCSNFRVLGTHKTTVNEVTGTTS